MKRIVDIEKIIAVLLQDGKWHEVLSESFKVDGYINAEGGECDVSKGLSNMHGATWIDAESGTGLACPLTSITAFEYVPRKSDKFAD